MRDNYPELALRVLGLFHNGANTLDIAKTLKAREETVERILHTALAVERFKKTKEEEIR